MVGAPEEGREVVGGSEMESRIGESYVWIARVCRSEGLSSPDADDVAQDIWLWLLRSGLPFATITKPWLRVVARNFVLRHRRRMFRQQRREALSLDDAPEPRTGDGGAALEKRDLFDRMDAGLPDTDRRLLDLIRRGHTLAEAAGILEIPRGSRMRHYGRLVACGRLVVARRRATVPPGRCETTASSEGAAIQVPVAA